MSEAGEQTLRAEWNAQAARAMALWKGEVGGTYDTLASAIGSVGGGFTSAGLGQNLRPNGRKPRDASSLLEFIAKVIANKLCDRRPDLDRGQFEQAIRRHIVAGTPSPLTEAPKSVAQKGSTTGVSSALFAFDLWTPGQSGEAIVRQFAPDLGPEGAKLVKDLSRQAVEAIGRGNFAKQRDVANEAIRLGQAAPNTPLYGEGLYLKAEALRLMADFEPDRGEAKRLRREAEDTYGQAEVALRGDPRPIRGRARTMEVLGDLDGAMNEFDRSLAALDAKRVSAGETDLLSLTHERVRTLRHKINCLAAMHAEAPLATVEARRRGDEIQRLILASESQHKEALQLFEQHREWWLIEWFMAQVLHAKGWAAVQEAGRASRRLEWSLRLRLEMINDGEGALSSVELGNLHWWSGVARDSRSALEPEQDRALATLRSALDRGENRLTIKKLGQQFLAAGAPPWSAN
jgi:hypothetical protein